MDRLKDRAERKAITKHELANRLFFRLYQCANMLHKTGSRAVGHIAVSPDTRDRRSRIVSMTKSGRHVWDVLAQPKIRSYYEQVLADFSTSDTTHTLHYLLKLLENMERVDSRQRDDEE
jgi:hypothetical protein